MNHNFIFVSENENNPFDIEGQGASARLAAENLIENIEKFINQELEDYEKNTLLLNLISAIEFPYVSVKEYDFSCPEDKYSVVYLRK